MKTTTVHINVWEEKMRKGQIKILRRVENNIFPDGWIDYLKREDLSIRQLNIAFSIFTRYQDGIYKEGDVIRLVDAVVKFHKEREIYGNIILWGLCKKKFSPDDVLLFIEEFVNNPSVQDGYPKEELFTLLFITKISVNQIITLYKKYEDRYSCIDKYYHTSGDNISPAENKKYQAVNRWYNILMRDTYEENESLNLPLREEYANASLTDSNLSAMEAEYAIQRNIPLKAFKACGYCSVTYFKNNIPYLEILPGGKERFDETKIYSIETLKAISKLLNDGPHQISINKIPCERIGIYYDKKYLAIELDRYEGVFYNSYSNQWSHRLHPSHKIKLIIFENKKIYEEREIRRIKKLVPLSIKRLCAVRNIYGEYGKLVYEFVIKYSTQVFNAPVIMDINRLILKDGYFLPPVTFNECEDIKNMNHLFKNRWENGNLINWNKTNVNLGYMIIRSGKIVKEMDRRKLLAIKNPLLIPSNIANKMIYHRRFGYHFIANFILEKIEGIEETKRKVYEQKIVDYMEMSYTLKQPIKIGFQSLKKIDDAHSKIVKSYNEKLHIHKIQIPKHSKFNELRKLLPEEFEWIRNGKRLYTEGVEMGHCVNSYYKNINSDKCAIYAFQYEGKRYTAEFRQHTNSNKYYIVQIQSKYDRGCPDNVRTAVKKLLKNDTPHG